MPYFKSVDELTKIGQLELSQLTDEEVLRLDVSVQDSSPMAVRKTSKQLEEEQLDVLGVETARILLQVLREIRVLRNAAQSLKCI